MTDLVIGVIHNYGWEEVKNWVLSLNASGFSGRKVLIAYTMKPGLADKLKEHDIELIAADFHSRGEKLSIPPLKVIDIRHFHIWYFLKDLDLNDYQYVISTDVRDVIFQSNPSDWLNKHFGERDMFLAPSEGIRLQDEPWNARFMYEGFGPIIYDYFKEAIVVNCGTIAGRASYFRDMALTLFSLAERNLMFNMDCIDQTSLLVLMYTLAKAEVRLVYHDEGWACQCGVMLDPQKIDTFRPKLLDPEPRVKNELVYTSTDKLFALVHQYNRIPELNAAIEEKYK